jgi:ABC-type Mn2+/Zn2+ transport system permease subunit
MTIEGLLLSVAAAIAAGLVGCFAVMRRMALAADALAHVALPGIGIAIALDIHPLVGAVVMLLFGALLVWALEDRTRLSTETIIGVVFSAALAVGSMLTSGESLIDALFGHTSALAWPETLFALAVSTAVVVFIVTHKNRLVIALVSPDIARTAGIDVRRLDLLYLEMFALTVALGLRYLGVLLMGSLLIIPAATAKRLSKDLRHMLAIASTVAVIVTVGGSFLAGFAASGHRPDYRHTGRRRLLSLARQPSTLSTTRMVPPASLRGGYMRRRVMVRADRLERVDDFVRADRLIRASREQDVVHRHNAKHRAAKPLDRQPPDPMFLHLRQRRVHVVLRTARHHDLSGDLADSDLRGRLIARCERDVHIAIGDDARELAVVYDGQDPAVAIQHQSGGGGEIGA